MAAAESRGASLLAALKLLLGVTPNEELREAEGWLSPGASGSAWPRSGLARVCSTDVFDFPV